MLELWPSQSSITDVSLRSCAISMNDMTHIKNSEEHPSFWCSQPTLLH